MAPLERFRTTAEGRRAWRRVSVRFTMRCRRLGLGGVDESVEAVDLSPGGVRLRAPDKLGTGDVVLCSIDVGGEPVGLKGLVVHTSGRRQGSCDVHVAWTNLSDGNRDALARLLEMHDVARRSTSGES